MAASEKRTAFVGWLVLVINGIVLGVFGAYGFSAKHHNEFFITLLLISMGIVLFFGMFFARD